MLVIRYIELRHSRLFEVGLLIIARLNALISFVLLIADGRV